MNKKRLKTIESFLEYHSHSISTRLLRSATDGDLTDTGKFQKYCYELGDFLQNVKEQSGEALTVSPCSPSLFCGDLPPIPLYSNGLDSYTNSAEPIDLNSVRKSIHTGAVRERGNGQIILVVRDPDNPDCVVEIVDSVESMTKDKQSESIRDARGYLGYIVNGEFVRNKKVSLNQMFKSVGVEGTENGMIRGNVKTNVPVIGEHIAAAYENAPLNEETREAVQRASVGGKLGGEHIEGNFLANVQGQAPESGAAVETNLNKQNMEENNKTQRDSGCSAPPCSASSTDQTGCDDRIDPVESALTKLHRSIRPVACSYKEKEDYEHETLGRGDALEIYYETINLLDRHYPTARKSKLEHPLGWVRKEKQLFGTG